MYALMQAAVYADVHGWRNDGWGDGYWWVWRLGMLLIWFLIIALAFWWFRRRGWGPRHEPSGLERARGILAERYARGEIDAQEYQERLARLR